MNWRKAAAISAGTLAVLLAGAAIAVHVLVDPERLKETARERVRAALGRDLLVDTVSLTLFPWPAVHATKVALSNPPWARDRQLFQADSVDAEIELLPLLAGKVGVRTLSLEGVRAALEEAQDGSVSWQFTTPEPAKAQPAAQDEAGPFSIAAVRIRDFWISHRAKGSEKSPYHVEEASLDVGAGQRDVRLRAKLLRNDRPLEVSARFADLSRLGMAGAVTDGQVELAWAETRATVSGKFPLERGLKGQALHVEAKSASIDDVLQFFEFRRGRTAPFTLALDAREADGRMKVSALSATLGEMRLAGELDIAMGEKPRFSGRLRADRIDWLRTLAQAGGEVKPPRHDEEVFHADPVAWHAFAALGNLDGTLDLQVKWFRMGNGLELQDVDAKAAFGGGKTTLAPFAAKALGGSAKGSIALDAGRKTIAAKVDGENLSLERWFRERGSRVPFTGGPMKLESSLTFTGATFRELAASTSGKARVQVGKGRWLSARAGEIEGMMVDALATKDSADIEFECIAAKLDFRNGRASGKRILGARSASSVLLTSGTIDLREEKLDLRGDVRAKKGMTIGLATLAGAVQITGRLAKPTMQMDPDAKPALIAKAAAAIATSGATLLGGALLDAASREDPCAAVFR